MQKQETFINMKETICVHSEKAEILNRELKLLKTLLEETGKETYAILGNAIRLERNKEIAKKDDQEKALKLWIDEYIKGNRE